MDIFILQILSLLIEDSVRLNNILNISLVSAYKKEIIFYIVEILEIFLTKNLL